MARMVTAPVFPGKRDRTASCSRAANDSPPITAHKTREIPTFFRRHGRDLIPVLRSVPQVARYPTRLRCHAGNPDFWTAAAKQVEERALAGTPSGDWRFDTLIVDEAQDFEGDWFETVRLFLRADADVLWLEDPNQNVRGVDPPGLHGQGSSATVRC